MWENNIIPLTIKEISLSKIIYPHLKNMEKKAQRKLDIWPHHGSSTTAARERWRIPIDMGRRPWWSHSYHRYGLLSLQQLPITTTTSLNEATMNHRRRCPPPPSLPWQPLITATTYVIPSLVTFLSYLHLIQIFFSKTNIQVTTPWLKIMHSSPRFLNGFIPF